MKYTPKCKCGKIATHLVGGFGDSRFICPIWYRGVAVKTAREYPNPNCLGCAEKKILTEG